MTRVDAWYDCTWNGLQGVVSSGINFSLQSWAIQRGGPLLVSLYTPLQTVIVAILSVVLLGDSYYLGRYDSNMMILRMDVHCFDTIYQLTADLPESEFPVKVTYKPS